MELVLRWPKSKEHGNKSKKINASKAAAFFLFLPTC